MKARTELLQRCGGRACRPSIRSCCYSGWRRLSLRMERHVANARGCRRFSLPTTSRVAWVSYPGLADHPTYELAQTYLPDGPGAVFSFGLAGGFDAGVSFIESVELASHLANVGDAKTLVVHPASTTHQQLPAAERVAAGVGDDLIRISVGLETVEDIVWDIDRALGSAQ